MAEIEITKQAAAHRLILAAVRMHNRHDDLLAIHVVAASALNLLRELLKTRGDNFEIAILESGLFVAAKARHEGRPLPNSREGSKQLEELIENIVAAIRDGDVSTASDLGVSISKSDRWMLLHPINGPYNFLKHADQDPLATLVEDEVKHEKALVYAVAAYSMLFPVDQVPQEVKEFLVGIGVITEDG